MQPRITFLLSELQPLFSFSHGVINKRFLQCALDLSCNLEICSSVQPIVLASQSKTASYLHFLPFVINGILYRDPNAIFIHVILDLWELQFLNFNIISPARLYGSRISHFFR